MTRGLPPLIRLLFRLLPAGERPQIVADMEELYGDRVLRHGAIRARVWILVHAAWLVWALRRDGRATQVAPRTADDAGGRLFADITMDIRFSARQMRAAPGYTATLLLVLAVGIGAATSIYSVVDSALFAPLPYPDADNLVLIGEAIGTRTVSVAYPNFRDWRERSRSFETMAAYQVDAGTLRVGSAAIGVKSYRVTSSFFSVLRSTPMLGRAMGPADDDAGAGAVAVLGHRRWLETFGGDPNVLGRTVILDDEPFTVIGVMPPGFEFYRAADLWVPIGRLVAGSELDNRAARAGTAVIARLAPGVREADARQELADIAQQLATEYPATNRSATTTVQNLRDVLVGAARPGLLALLTAVGALLAIGCLNAGNLVSARMSTRVREFAVRAALGAGRRRLARQLVVESLLLTGLGCVAGLAIAALLLRIAVASDVGGIPRLVDATINPRVFAFAASLSGAIGVLFGLLPLVYTRWRTLTPTLQDNGRGAAGSARLVRLRAALVVGQIGLSLVLVTGSALMIQTVARLLTVDPGFDPTSVLTVSLQLSTPGTREEGQRQTRAFYRELADGAAGLPGVVSAAVVNPLPLGGSNRQNRFWVEGQPYQVPDDLTRVDTAAISERYFETMQIPVRQGRTFEPGDVGPLSVAIVDEAFVRRFWPDREPLGRELRMGPPDSSSPSLRVIGVVGSVHQYDLREPPRPQVYLAQGQWPLGGTFVVRTAGDPIAVVPLIRHLVQEVNPNVPVLTARPGSDLVRTLTSPARFSAFVITLFAILALGLAGLGIYGMAAYEVSVRRKEIGIRIALGATRTVVRGAILRRALMLVVAGSILGVGGAYLLGGTLKAMIFGVSSTDPATYLAALAVVATTAIAGTVVPSLRASRIDPQDALRS